MFMYELLTTHQPYEHCDNVKEHVLEGGRPALTHRVISISNIASIHLNLQKALETLTIFFDSNQFIPLC